MSVEEEIAQLRAQIAALENVGPAEAEATAAKQAYRDDPTTENKARHRAASQALVEARQATRALRPGVGIGGDAVASDGGEA